MSLYSQNFYRLLYDWYDANHRVLPWRETDNPYYIWLSEVILQQTRVVQGMEYYHRFVSTYPTIELLASADEGEVLRLWQGLGYYSRARNLHKAAKMIVENQTAALTEDRPAAPDRRQTADADRRQTDALNSLMKSRAQDTTPALEAPDTGHQNSAGQRRALNDRARGLGENGVEDEHICQGGSGQAVTGKRGAVEFIPLRRLA